MKTTLFVFAILLVFNATAQRLVIENSKENEEMRWGSVSAQKPNYGFYGQEFEFLNDVEIKSIAVYVYDHPEYNEEEATINYAVWSFDSIPQKELYLSDAVKVSGDEIGNWKTYVFPEPLKVKKGKYLFAVGQSEIQGFVGFGNGVAKDGYKSKGWTTMPIEGYSDGSEWFDMHQLLNSMPDISEEQKKEITNSTIMMKVEVE